MRRAVRMDRPGIGPSHLGITVSPIRDESGHEHGAICLFTDLSEIADLEDQLRLRDSLARLGELTASEADIWVAGIVSGVRPLKTKKGDRMAVFTLDDVDGGLEVVVFPEAFTRSGALIEADAMLLARGKFEKDDESARLVATELLPIAALRERTTREVAIHLAVPPHGRPTFEALAELLARHRGDRKVFLELDVKAQDKPLRVKADVIQRVKPSEKLVAELEQLCGAGSVELR